MSFYMPPDALNYPRRLNDLRKPPDGIWVRNAAFTDALIAPTVAIVGARTCSDYGAHVARTLAFQLAQQGVTVVSGMAAGIDGHAHRGALEANGRTVAVLGCGIERDYPSFHADLAAHIVLTGGLVLSEYEPGTPVAPWRLIMRNHLIAALSDAVIVVEAREKSGSRHAADAAVDLGRKLFAVPGRIWTPLSEGTNALIRDGLARPCLSAADVMDALEVLV